MKEYRFYREENDWFIDLPEYLAQGGSKADLAMVAGADTMLERIAGKNDAVVLKINIIPFEGATEGRELYREAKLMQAVEELRSKKYKKALELINASKLWPVNLGVGKPYDEDIDTRLEDWMSYLAYQEAGNASLAKAALERIIRRREDLHFATAVVTAWALEKVGKRDEAIQWMDDLIQKYPENVTLKWAKAVFLGQPADFLEEDKKNGTILI